MIRSMTGYGKAETEISTGKITVEIRSLNAKGAEINVKSSLLPRDKDIETRKKLSERLLRGTIDMYISYEPSPSQATQINTELLRGYLAELRSILAEESGLPESSLRDPETNALLLSSVIRLPDLSSAKKQDIISAEDWPAVEKAIDSAIASLEEFRIREGKALFSDISSRVKTILSLYDEVETIDPQRVEAIKEKLLKALSELGQKPDQSRFEQEMIYYLEKYDINEEKVRLREHCRYFTETLENDPLPGKKLGFIIQEMGREINTTGSKANNADIQKLVVKMKDELEKIREQSMNVL